MADLTIKFKGNPIVELSESGTKTLKTAGKYCEGDITVEYVKPAGVQVASGSYNAKKSHSMTITPGFIVKNICFAVAYSTSTNESNRGGGMYIDGVKSGDIRVFSSDKLKTIVTFSKEFAATIYWLATS